MKKYFTLILLALLPMLANAYDAEIDGIYYNFSENEAEVTCGNDMYSGKVVIPEAVTYNDRNYSVTNIGSHAFYGCSALISIVIPNSVRTISLAAFYSSGLTSVNIPNSVTSIGNCAFADCRGLTSVTIGNSVTSIGGDAFSYCSCLIDVYCYAYIIPNTGSDVFKKTTISSATLHVLPYSLDAYKTTEPWSGFGNIVSLYENEDYACIDGIYYRFRGNEAEVSYGKMHPHPILVDPVEDLIYESYSYSGDVVIPESVTYKGKTYDVKRIGDYAFSNCRKLSSVTIPNSVIRIGDVAFYLCTDLSSITIPKSVTSIGNGAFAGCINMDFVSVESGNKRYDSRNNCNAIIETATNTLIVSGINTVIPNSVTSIGSGAFIFSNMNSITIPESVTSIGSWAFYGLCCLDDVYCLAEEVPETKIDAFDETYIDESTLHVPASAIEKYRTTEPWSRFGTIVPLELFTAKTEEGVEMAFKIIDEEEKTCQVGNGEEASINVSTDSLVNIPEEVNGYTVKAISSNSFYGTAIKEVTIPESVTTIASKAFGNNTNLETITSECTTPFDFEDDSFDDPIYDITIMNVPQASASAYQSSKTGEKFSNVQASSSSSSSATGRLFNAPVWKDHIMTFRVIDESSCQVGNGNNASVYTGTAESIKIPNNLSGYVVKAIGRRGFYKCVNLTRLYLDDNIEEIGEEAFYGCVKLRTLDLPKSVKIILNAFDTDITVNIHPGQEFLCDEAIGGDGNVSYEIVATEEDYEDTKEIHILASMKKISENRVYSYCRNIIKMWVDGGNPTYDSRNECNAIIRTADNKLLYGCQKTVIPNTVTAINDYAFEGHSHLSKIIIPAKVANIGEGAFADCTGLKEVKSFIRNPYPINDNTFSGKTYQDATLYVPYGKGALYKATDGWKNFKHINELDPPQDIIIFADPLVKEICVENWDTDDDGELTETEAKEVTTLGLAFMEKEIKTFNELKYFKNLTNINESAFQGCSSLTTITIPNSVTNICSCAFQECTRLHTISIPKNVTSIGDHAFQGCSSLKTITIPSSVTHIGNSAFYECTGLNSIDIPKSVKYIDDYAFYGCIGLESATICGWYIQAGEGFQNTIWKTSEPVIIGSHAFDGCSQMTSLKMSSDITIIGDYAFSSCSRLNDVDIPHSVITIGEGAFCDCSSIKHLNIPLSVESIGSLAFLRCSGLKSVTIPHRGACIGQDAFKGCSNIIDLLLDCESLIENWFYDSRESVRTLLLGYHVRTIGDDFFYGFSNLESVTIWSGLTSIGKNAFRDCTSLTSVNIPNSVTSIGEAAFKGCMALMTITSDISVPFAINDNTFSEGTYKNSTLNIPYGTKALYQATPGWKNFFTFNDDRKKCAIPTIGYVNGKLIFKCETEDVTFKYNISDEDIKNGAGNEIDLTVTYLISVYATKEGYDDSDVAKAMLCWMDQQPDEEGLTDEDSISELKAHPVLIQVQGGDITLQGVREDTPISIYGIDGKLYGSTIVEKDCVTIATSLQPGSIALVKIGEKTIKVAIK